MHIRDTLDISVLDRLGSEKYDIILMDPPWTNKHVKRIKNNASSYHMMENEVLEDMELSELMTEDAVVVVWVTNKERHRESVRMMFSKWGMTMAASWNWIKVTVYCMENSSATSQRRSSLTRSASLEQGTQQ